MPAYLIYGENTYSSIQKLQEIKNRFSDRNLGEANIVDLKDENVSAEQIKQAVFLVPFLAPKRLTIVRSFFKKNSSKEEEKVLQFLEQIPPFSILLFYEQGEIERKSPLLEKLKELKAVFHYPLPSQEGLLRWIIKEVSRQGGKIEEGAARFLAEAVGPDLWRLSLEINKLLCYKEGGVIKQEDIEAMVKTELQSHVFNLIDAIAERNAKSALRLVNELVYQGENESYLLSMIAYQFRNLLLIKEAFLNHRAPKVTGLHPYVLKKITPLAKNFNFDFLKEGHRKIVETDLKIKTGLLKPLLALELLITELIYE